MANEFIARKGIINLGNTTVTGDEVITGSLTVLGGITGAITGSATSASYAANASFLNNSGSGEFVPTGSFNTFSSSILTYTGSANSRFSSIESTTASLNSASGSAITRLNALEVTSGSNISRLSSLEAKTGSYATTGSNTFIGNQTITGSILGSGSLTINGCITATGQIVAQTINVQQVTSSIVYSCGSNILGTSTSNTQTLCGNVFNTGSVACFSNAVCSNTVSTTDGTNTSTLANNYLRYNGGDFYVDACAVGGNFRIRTSNTTALDSTALFICGKNSNVGIGTTTPAYKLDVNGSFSFTTGGNYLQYSSGILYHGNYYQYPSGNDYLLFARTSGGLNFGTNDTQRLSISSTGIACFACQVCVPNIISTGVSGGRYATFGAPTNGGYITFEVGGTPFGDLGSYCAQYGTGDATTLLLGSRTGYALALGTNSTEKVRIDTTGNLMVGSTSAGNAGTINVSVGCAGTTAGGLQLWAASNQTHYIQFGDGTTGGQPYAGYVSYAHGTDSLAFGTATATRAIISSTGIACFSNTVCAPGAIFTSAVGVNTTSITDCLTVVGTTAFRGAASNTQVIQFEPSSTGAGGTSYIYSTYSGTASEGALGLGTYSCKNAIHILPTCNRIGIGTTSPGTKLEVVSKADDADRTVPHNVLTITAEQGNAPYGFFGGAILFKNRSYISGLVNSSRIRSVIYDDGAPANCGGGLWFESTSTPGGTLTPALAISYAGRVGIGCTLPTYHLEVRCAASTSCCYLAAMFSRSTGANDGVGDIVALGANGVSSIAGMYRVAGSWGLEFQTANQNTRMRIDNSGNVGINTLTPNARLEVYPGTISNDACQEIIRLDIPGANIFSAATGYINFRGYDISNNVQRDVAWIGAELVPNLDASCRFGGNLVFRTTSSGLSQTPQERMRITSTGITCFACRVCAPKFIGGDFSTTTCSFSATSAGTNYDVALPGNSRWLVSVSTNSVYHWNGILALTTFDSADFGVNILTCGSYQTAAAVSVVNSGGSLRFCFSQNVGTVTLSYMNIAG